MVQNLLLEPDLKPRDLKTALSLYSTAITNLNFPYAPLAAFLQANPKAPYYFNSKSIHNLLRLLIDQLPSTLTILGDLTASPLFQESVLVEMGLYDRLKQVLPSLDTHQLKLTIWLVQNSIADCSICQTEFTSYHSTLFTTLVSKLNYNDKHMVTEMMYLFENYIDCAQSGFR